MVDITRIINQALGLQFETLRPDRDQYVTIDYDNVSSSKEKWFRLGDDALFLS